MESGLWPAAIRESAASIKTVVLPVPVAPVTINGVPRWATTACCSALSEIFRVKGRNPSSLLRTRRSGDEGLCLLTVAI